MGTTARLIQKAGLFLVTAVFIVCFSGCGGSAGQPASPADAGIYSKVVSLTPSVTRSIYQLGAQDILTGCSSYCEVSELDSITVSGSVIGPDIEKIVSLKPDLVILSDFVSENDVETLEKFGLKVEIFRSPGSFEELCSEFIRLGKMVGRGKEAELIVEESREEVRFLQEKSKEEDSKPGIFMQIGASPVFSVIPGTFMDDYITFTGAKNIAAELTNGIVGREYVVSKNPDFIFIVTMGDFGDSEKVQWSRFTRMNAARENNIHIIDARIACEPTPGNFMKTLRIMAGYLENGKKE
ncbi:MAG: ABC transporter substrate-binding protein [Bacteroidales bacterium]|nr:ABC transporter substrate-binding protein [Bacteroidales bacterium]